MLNAGGNLELCVKFYWIHLIFCGRDVMKYFQMLSDTKLIGFKGLLVQQYQGKKDI